MEKRVVVHSRCFLVIISIYRIQGKNIRLHLQAHSDLLPLLIAKEFHFHHSCYRQISKSSDLCNSDSETRKKCFNDLVSYIEDILINEGEVVCISCISKIYENIQKDKGIAIQGTSHFLLKARLQNHFKRRIDFFRKNETTIDLIYGTSKGITQGVTQQKKK